MRAHAPAAALVAAQIAALCAAPAAMAEPVVWGVRAEQLEYRWSDDGEVLAVDADAFIGTDEFKVVWRTESEFDLDDESFERLENQLRVQTPISDFFDLVGGIRVDTPEGPDRVHAVVGVHGLAPQWFEIDADLFVSDYPGFRLEAEYEGLITNRIILTPSLEFDLPFRDDPALDTGAWGPKLEVGLRLSYDLIDRAVAPYVGVHYERVFGETSLLTQNAGEEPGTFYVLGGVRLMF